MRYASLVLVDEDEEENSEEDVSDEGGGVGTRPRGEAQNQILTQVQTSSATPLSSPVRSGWGHHLLLRSGPFFPVGQNADVDVFPQRRQMAIVGPGLPKRRMVSQPQFRTPPAGCLLLAGQPVPQ